MFNRKGVYKNIFIIIIFVLIASLLIFIKTKSKNNQTSFKYIPTPAIPKPYKHTLPVTIEGAFFDLPTKLDLYEITFSGLNKNNVKNILTSLGLNEEPKETRDVNQGLKYYYSNKDFSLWVTPSNYLITYTLNTIPPEKRGENLKELIIEDLAERFLKEKLNINTQILKPIGIEFYNLKPSEEGGYMPTNKENYYFSRIIFTLKDMDYPIYLSMPLEPCIYVDITKNGNIIKASAVSIESINKSEAVYIKNYEDIKSNISNASLITVKGQYLSIFNIKPETLKQITIDQIKIVYLIDERFSTSIQPVFFMEGDIEILNTTANRSILLLPAVKQ